MSRRLAVAVAAASLAVALVPAAHAALPFKPCSDQAAVECAPLAVPLDRSGAVGGTVTLQVRRLVRDRARGTLVLLQGGPGGAAAETFLRAATPYFALLFPDWTLVAFDDRGTGSSDVLRCSALDSEPLQDAAARATNAERCAAEVGARRRFFTTRAHVDDLEAVRQALGVDRVALYGISYGTKHALGYALTYPGHVDRLVLESVLRPEFPDPLERSTLRAVPQALASACADGCPGVGDAGADFAALAEQLGDGPLRGTIVSPRGRVQEASLDRQRLLDLVLTIDVNAFTRAVLPASVRAALNGDARPILRLADVYGRLQVGNDPQLFSAALFVSTICEDGPYAWQRDTPVAERPAALQRAADTAAAAGEVPASFAWALTMSPYAQWCLRWPNALEPPLLGAGPLPDVPVLALAGDLDLRTPAADAVAVAAGFPRGRALVVPGAGHSVTGVSSCATGAVRAFLRNLSVPQSCPRVLSPLTPQSVLPQRFADVRPVRGATGRIGKTLGAVALTLDDAARFAALAGEVQRGLAIGGLRGGTLEPSAGGAVLSRYSVVPGVWISGVAHLVSGTTVRLDGRIRVGGTAAAAGTLLVGDGMSGLLGGKKVRVRTR